MSQEGYQVLSEAFLMSVTEMNCAMEGISVACLRLLRGFVCANRNIYCLLRPDACDCSEIVCALRGVSVATATCLMTLSA